MKRIVGGLVFALLMPFASVSAASQHTPSGIAVSPAIKQLQVQSDQEEVSFSEEITNNTLDSVQIKVGFADFKALNESGGIAFLGQNAGAVEQSHGLAKWVSVSTQQVGLDPGQSAEVQIRLSDLGSLPEGGHYGAITYQVLKATPNGGGNRVSVNQVVSSLVFLTTAGEGTEHLKMPPAVVPSIEFSLPSELDLFFTNDGNTQTIPRGSLTIYGRNAAQPAATAVVNAQQAMVLPNSTRLLPTPITVTGHPWWPGRYHLQVRYRPDGTMKFQTYTASFVYINPWLFVLLVVVVALAWWLLPKLWRQRGKLRPIVKGLARTMKAVRRFVVEVVLANIAYQIVRFLDRKKEKTAGSSLNLQISNAKETVKSPTKSPRKKPGKKTSKKDSAKRPKKSAKST